MFMFKIYCLSSCLKFHSFNKLSAHSIGCIFGELLKKEAMLQGRGELEQIELIFKQVGAPTSDSWPEFLSLPNASVLRWRNKEPPKLSSSFPVNSFSGGQTYLDSNGYDLLKKLLTLSPKDRITARDALDHAYFKEGVERKTPRFDFSDEEWGE